MRKIIIVLIMLLLFPVMGVCEEKEEKVYDPNAVYLGDDPTPHARWVREKSQYAIVYSLKNLLKRDEMKRQQILDEIRKQQIMEAQEAQPKIDI